MGETRWGAFPQIAAVPRAYSTAVALAEAMGFDEAAAMGQHDGIGVTVIGDFNK